MKPKNSSDRIDHKNMEKELVRIKRENLYEKEKLQALLDISSGLYESKTFEDIGKTIVLNLQRFKLIIRYSVVLASYTHLHV